MNAKFCFLFFLFSLFFITNSNGQKELDSLKHVLNVEKNPVKKLELYALIGERYYLFAPDSALYYTLHGIERGEQISSSLRDTAYYDNMNGLYNNAAFLQQKKGNYYNAILLYKKSLDSFNHYRDSTSAPTANLNLASLYFDIGELDLALNYLETFKRKLRRTDDEALAKCKLLIGSIYAARGETEIGLNNFYTALALFKTENDSIGIGRALNNIGEINIKLHDYDQAYDNFSISLKYFTQGGDLRGMSESNYLISIVKLKNNKLDSALFFASKSLQEAREINYPINISKASLQLFLIYQRKSDFKNALEMMLLHNRMDSILSVEEAVKMSAKEQLKTDYDKQALTVKIEQSKRDALNAEELKRQKTFARLSIAVGFLMLVIFVLGIRSYRAKQKANKTISIQKNIVELKNREILDSINYANRIQKTLLAQEDFLIENLKDFCILFKPKDIVSGDFYWATSDQEHTYFSVCDSTGHGVPGAFMSLLNISFLNEAINEKKIIEPAQVFNHVRNRLISGVSKDGAQDGMDGILFQINNKTKKILFAAANNAPLVVRNKNVIHLPCNKMPVGKSPNQNISFTSFEFNLEKDDLLIAYTDGYADQFGGAKGKKLKYKSLDNLLIENSSLPLLELKNKLELYFENWKGTLEQVDDVLIFAFRVS